MNIDVETTFQEFAWKTPKVTDKPITKVIVINKISVQFTQDELNVVLTKIKNRKAAGLDEIPLEL